MNNKIYIAGPITGVKDYITRFQAAEYLLTRPDWWAEHTPVEYAKRYNRIIMFEVVSPINLTFRGNPLTAYSWLVSMIVCVCHLLPCSHVYMLRGWRNSKGAKIEHRLSRLLRKNIIYQK